MRTESSNSDLSVAILAGGASRRMGRDKALLRWCGSALIDRTIEAGRHVTGSQDVFIVGDRPEYRGRGVAVAGDLYPGTGPIGGIATALRTATSERIFVLAVDLPLVNADLLSAMAGHVSGADVLVPVVKRPSRAQADSMTYQTLHAIYRKTCLPAIEAGIGRGDFQVIGMYRDLSVEPLPEEWLRRWDPNLLSLENANTPEDLERLRRLSCRHKELERRV